MVIHVGDDDLVARRGDGLADGQADQAHEGGSVHAEGHLIGVIAAQEGGDLAPCLGNYAIDLDALGVAAAALNVEVQQVPRHRVEHDARRLGPGGIVEIDERGGALQGRKPGADRLDGKRRGGRGKWLGGLGGGEAHEPSISRPWRRRQAAA